MSFDWQNFKVRCSAIGKVMSNSKSNPVLTELQAETLAKYRAKLEMGGMLTPKQATEMLALEEKEKNGSKVILSDTCIGYLMEEYAWIVEKMIPANKEAITNLPAVKKGKIVEGDSMILLSRVDGVLYKTHKPRIYNEFLSGEIDYYAGTDVMNAEVIVDNKASWDYPIFLKKIHTGLEPGQREQVQGYMDITGAPLGFIANTLVDCPDEILQDLKWSLARRLNALTTESPDFLIEWADWERSLKFGHIAPNKRVNKIKIEPMTEFELQKLYDRIKTCREWLAQFHESYQKINL